MLTREWGVLLAGLCVCQTPWIHGHWALPYLLARAGSRQRGWVCHNDPSRRAEPFCRV